jgi:hypothetical protein
VGVAAVAWRIASFQRAARDAPLLPQESGAIFVWAADQMTPRLVLGLRVVCFVLAYVAGTLAIAFSFTFEQQGLNHNLLFCLAIIMLTVPVGMVCECVFCKAICFTTSTRCRCVAIAAGLVLSWSATTAGSFVPYPIYSGSHNSNFYAPLFGLPAFTGACVLYIMTRWIQRRAALGRGESSTTNRQSRCVCSKSTSTYGCTPMRESTGTYWETLVHVYTVLIPLPAVASVQSVARFGISVLVFFLVYMRLLNFWLKMEACREKPTAQIARFWRTAFLAWFIALNECIYFADNPFIRGEKEWSSFLAFATIFLACY